MVFFKVRPLVALVALVAALALVGGGAAQAMAKAKTTNVTVGMYEMRFVLSKKAVPRGKVVFKVTNKGRIPHDFKIAGKKIPVIGSGKSRTLTINFTKKGRFFFLCTVPGHVDGGMFGYFTVK